jgi:hypothetical protein
VYDAVGSATSWRSLLWSADNVHPSLARYAAARVHAFLCLTLIAWRAGAGSATERDSGAVQRQAYHVLAFAAASLP